MIDLRRGHLRHRRADQPRSRARQRHRQHRRRGEDRRSEAHVPARAPAHPGAAHAPAGVASGELPDRTARHATSSSRRISTGSRSTPIPTVPMLDIYAQTPTAQSAAALANAAVDQLRAYLARVATAQKTPSKDQIRLVQTGPGDRHRDQPGRPAPGRRDGVRTDLPGLVRQLVTFVARVRAGWRVAGDVGASRERLIRSEAANGAVCCSPALWRRRLLLGAGLSSPRLRAGRTGRGEARHDARAASLDAASRSRRRDRRLVDARPGARTPGLAGVPARHI